MSNTLKLKNVTIGDLQNQTAGDVYVMNQTKGQEKGLVLMTIPKQNGQGMDTVKVPATFIPTNLTLQVSKEQLLQSSDFRRAVQTRRLKIIDNEQAETILETREANEEMERIETEQEKIRNHMSGDVDLIEDTQEYSLGEQAEEDETEYKMASNNTSNEPNAKGINVNVATMVEEINAGEVDEVSAISTMRNLENIRKRDCKYVYKHAPKKFKRLKEVAVEIADRIRGESKKK